MYTKSSKTAKLVHITSDHALTLCGKALTNRWVDATVFPQTEDHACEECRAAYETEVTEQEVNDSFSSEDELTQQDRNEIRQATAEQQLRYAKQEIVHEYGTAAWYVQMSDPRVTLRNLKTRVEGFEMLFDEAPQVWIHGEWTEAYDLETQRYFEDPKDLNALAAYLVESIQHKYVTVTLLSGRMVQLHADGISHVYITKTQR